MSEPRLTIVEVVTKEHGETFAEEWYEGSMRSEATSEAFHTSVVFHTVVDLFAARRARPTFSMIDSAVAVQM